ncbi:hypothetical protein L6252_03545 [Candidatus Parcubacteria bacterium]|nr:hypothetical protein [Candidatus Parcubacteria bacterium]
MQNNNIEKSFKSYMVGVCGVGMVGGAMQRYFEGKGIKPLLYDPGKELGSLEELNQADVIFICVPTPFISGKGFDLSYVEQACSNLTGEKIVVIKSTVVPGTTEVLQRKFPQHKFLFNPEFLTELTADQDMNYPDRQIIGYTKESFTISKDIIMLLPLAPFERIIPATEAELVKYYGNNWFSVKVIYANQFYNLCEKIGANYNTVMESASADKRIGPSHLVVMHKGYRGFGGKCLPKDIRAMIEFGDKEGVDMELLKTTEKVNNDLMKQQGIADPEKFSKRE